MLDPDTDAFILTGEFLLERRVLHGFEEDRVVVAQNLRHSTRGGKVELTSIIVEVRRRRGGRDRHRLHRTLVEIVNKCFLSFWRRRQKEVLALNQPAHFRLAREGSFGERVALIASAADQPGRAEPGRAEESPLRQNSRAEAQHRNERDNRDDEEQRPQRSFVDAWHYAIRIKRWFHS
jgi:hypothetical protein